MIEQFINFVIRPPRAEYIPDQYLWEKQFTLAGKIYQRQDLELKNARGHTLQCSHYLPSPLPEDTSLPCVIYCHGNSGCRVDANEAAVLLLPSNITVFTLDFSGSGLSDGDHVSLGWHEKDDLKMVVSHLRSNKQVSRIGLWGRSMGAVTSLLYGAEDPFIAGMVLDSAFSNLYVLMMELADLNNIRLPKFTVKMAVHYMRRVIEKKAKFDIMDLNCLQVAPKTFIPVLFGHANDDQFVQPPTGAPPPPLPVAAAPAPYAPYPGAPPMAAPAPLHQPYTAPYTPPQAMPVPPQTAPAPSAVPQHALSPAKASVGHAAAPGPALRATWRTSQPAPDSGGFLCGTVTPAFTVWLGSAKGLIYLCSARGEIIRSFPAHNGRIHGLLPLWPLVWSVGEDGAVHIWDSNTSPPRLISSLMAHKAPLRFISSVFVPSEGYMVMTGDATGVVCVWPVQPQAEPLARVTMPGQEPLQSMCQVTDAAWFGCRRGIHIFALQSLTLRRSIPVNAGVNRVLFVPGDGVWVATNSNIIVFSPEGNQLRTIEGHGSRVFALHFSPIFSSVFSGAFDKSVVAWDLRTHERVATLDGRHKDGVRVVLECAFGPQDHTLVTAGDADDMTVTCWSLTHAP